MRSLLVVLGLITALYAFALPVPQINSDCEFVTTQREYTCIASIRHRHVSSNSLNSFSAMPGIMPGVLRGVS